jgi:hypothetical protein
MKRNTTCSVLAAVAVLAAAGITSWGQPDSPVINAMWTAPTTGTAVEHYVGTVESWEVAGGDTIRLDFVTVPPAMTFSYSYGHSMRCRVAGVDSLGRQGPYSLWSEVWIDNGPPGSPSVPLLGLNLVEN